MHRHAFLILASCVAAGCGGDDDPSTTPSGGMPTNTTTFFVSSTGSTTGNLGGLQGADARCQGLATAAGMGGRIWRAYLSVERDPASGNRPIEARSRIGTGPWTNAAGVTVARTLDELHARTGDAAVFLDERGQRVNGQWSGSPQPNQHDILTGATADGRVLAGMTCGDWMSDSSSLQAQVGHSDGLGPGGNAAPPFSSWSSSHSNLNCADTAPRGGAGRIYCFAVN